MLIDAHRLSSRLLTLPVALCLAAATVSSCALLPSSWPGFSSSSAGPASSAKAQDRQHKKDIEEMRKVFEESSPPDPFEFTYEATIPDNGKPPIFTAVAHSGGLKEEQVNRALDWAKETSAKARRGDWNTDFRIDIKTDQFDGHIYGTDVKKLQTMRPSIEFMLEHQNGVSYDTRTGNSEVLAKEIADPEKYQEVVKALTHKPPKFISDEQTVRLHTGDYSRDSPNVEAILSKKGAEAKNLQRFLEFVQNNREKDELTSFTFIGDKKLIVVYSEEADRDLRETLQRGYEGLDVLVRMPRE